MIIIHIFPDESAYKEILDLLKMRKRLSLLSHLVTMQTYMPSSESILAMDFSLLQQKITMEWILLDNYLQDIAYSSQALVPFIEVERYAKKNASRFWGDHLPGTTGRDRISLCRFIRQSFSCSIQQVS